MKGQHGGVVIAGDYATVNFHYHYAAEQARLSESRNCQKKMYYNNNKKTWQQVKNKQTKTD